jgi:lysophospholipase L1-like esterase
MPRTMADTLANPVLSTDPRHVILVKPRELMRYVAKGNFRPIRRTPNRRILGLAALALVATSCNKSSNPPAGPTPLAPTAPVVYSAVGASDANGVGSSVVCIPFTECPNGMGYVQVTVRSLQSQGFTVTLRNLGIPTAVIGRDFQTLGQQYGRTIEGNFIDQEMPFILGNSTVVTIVAGGNDVNVITAALGGGAGGGDPSGYIDAQVRAFANDYSNLISGIRSRAPSARIVAVNVPNMAGLPYLAGASIDQRRAAQRAAVGMTTTVVNPLVSQGVTVVDAMCDGRTYQGSNYSSDGLHPNDAGYAFIASEVLRAMTTSSYPSPQSSCGGMTIVQ